MSRNRSWVVGLISLVGLAASSWAGEGAGKGSPLPTLEAFKPGQFTSDEVCGACHRDIYEVWKNRSVHSKSLNPAFMAAYQRANTLSEGKTRTLCPTCHAPTTMVTKDYDMKLAITREGITCDFCHSLRGVRIGDLADPFDLDLSLVKRGPMKRAVPSIHEVARSELHTSALLCGVCHEYRTPKGAALMTTYSEWEAGPYPKEGVICQGCHMPLFRGELVASQRTGSLDRIFINMHEVPGGHSLAQLQRALRVDLQEVRREPERTLVKVELYNDGAGHKVPTGLPSRRLILRASLTREGGKTLTQERVFQKVITDASGKHLLDDMRLFVEGTSIREDTRIGPRERRVEVFDFPVPRIHSAGLKVRLIYEYAPMTAPENRVETEIITLEKSLAKE